MNLFWSTPNNIMFYNKNRFSETNDQIFQRIRKKLFLTQFLPILPRGGAKSLVQKSSFLRHNFIWASSTTQKIKKTLDRQTMTEQMYIRTGRSCFIRPFRDIAKGLAVDILNCIVS